MGCISSKESTQPTIMVQEPYPDTNQNQYYEPMMGEPVQK